MSLSHGPWTPQWQGRCLNYLFNTKFEHHFISLQICLRTVQNNEPTFALRRRSWWITHLQKCNILSLKYGLVTPTGFWILCPHQFLTPTFSRIGQAFSQKYCPVTSYVLLGESVKSSNISLLVPTLCTQPHWGCTVLIFKGNSNSRHLSDTVKITNQGSSQFQPWITTHSFQWCHIFAKLGFWWWLCYKTSTIRKSEWDRKCGWWHPIDVSLGPGDLCNAQRVHTPHS